MSLLSTIAYDGTHETREIPINGFVSVIAALALGAAIGFAIADNPPAADTPVAAASGMALDDFIRLNTTSYEGLAPVTAPQTVTDQFLTMNISSYETFTPATATADPFLEMNIASYEGLAPVAAAQPQTVGQAFVDMNVTSYEGLAPAAVATTVVTQSAGDAFIDMNVRSYEGLVPSVVTDTRRSVYSQFLQPNSQAFNSLSPVEASAMLRSLTTADRDLWVLNVTSNGYGADGYADQPSGPR